MAEKVYIVFNNGDIGIINIMILSAALLYACAHVAFTAGVIAYVYIRTWLDYRSHATARTRLRRSLFMGFIWPFFTIVVVRWYIYGGNFVTRSICIRDCKITTIAKTPWDFVANNYEAENNPDKN